MGALKDTRIILIVSAIISIALGVVLIVWPTETALTFSRALSLTFLIAGAVMAVVALKTNKLALVGAALFIIIAIWAFANPKAILSVVPVAFGIWMIYHGIQDFVLLPRMRALGGGGVLLTILIGAISIVFGALCVAKAFGIVEIIVLLIGAMLIFDGVSDVFLAIKLSHADKIQSRAAKKAAAMVADRTAAREAAQAEAQKAAPAEMTNEAQAEVLNAAPEQSVQEAASAVENAAVQAGEEAQNAVYSDQGVSEG